MKRSRLFRLLASGTQVALRGGFPLLMVASLLLAQFGYPVWKVVAQKGDRPFPCQFSNCGCQTADQCRISCCCHSKSERVAWAVERGIDPDQVAVLTPDEKLELTFAAKLKQREKKSCCQTAAKSSCCSQPKVESCSDASQLGGSLALPKTERQEVLWVLAVSAHKCRGTGIEWIVAGMIARPPQPIEFQVEPRSARHCSAVEPLYFSPAAQPLLRPV